MKSKKRAIMYRGVFPLLLVVCALGILAACAQNGTQGQAPTSTGYATPTASTQQSIPAVTIKAMDFSYALPQNIPAGFVDINFVNNGAEPHQVQLVRLNDGVTFATFEGALKAKGPGAALGLGTAMGGANSILPGKSQEVILDLKAGQYAAVCFLTSQDSVTHYMKGMVQSFSVTGTSNDSQVTPPQASAEGQLKDFSFSIPGTLPAGAQVIKFTNVGQQAHEVTLVKLAPGKTITDVLAFLKETKPSGPPPFAPAGGLNAINPGSSAWLKLNLEPGNYVTLCFVPDRTTGKPHIMLGMIGAFVVK